MLVMLLSLGTAAFAAGPLSLEQAKQMALDYTGVNAADAVFTKAYKSYDDGREVYEIEFYQGGLEYEFNIDAENGSVLKYKKDWD